MNLSILTQWCCLKSNMVKFYTYRKRQPQQLSAIFVNSTESLQTAQLMQQTYHTTMCRLVQQNLKLKFVWCSAHCGSNHFSFETCSWKPPINTPHPHPGCAAKMVTLEGEKCGVLHVQLFDCYEHTICVLMVHCMVPVQCTCGRTRIGAQPSTSAKVLYIEKYHLDVSGQWFVF